MTFEEWYRANRQGTNINEFEAARDAWFAGQAVVNAAWNRAEALARPEEAQAEPVAWTSEKALKGPSTGFVPAWSYKTEEFTVPLYVRVPQEQNIQQGDSHDS